MTIKFEYRDMTDPEFKREQSAFDEHGSEFGNPPETPERHGFVAIDDEKFVGCSSGLAHRTNNQYNRTYALLK